MINNHNTLTCLKYLVLLLLLVATCCYLFISTSNIINTLILASCIPTAAYCAVEDNVLLAGWLVLLFYAVSMYLRF